MPNVVSLPGPVGDRQTSDLWEEVCALKRQNALLWFALCRLALENGCNVSQQAQVNDALMGPS